MNGHLDLVIPLLVGALTAAGCVIGLQFRDADAYERRRSFWQMLLVLLTMVATVGAVDSASGVGRPLAATLMAVFAAAAAIVAHFMWRRRVPDAEPRIRAIATAAAACAVLVVAGATALTYVGSKDCRQVEPLVQSSVASAGALMPAFDAKQSPTVGDYDNWAKIIREQAQQVTDGEIAQHAKHLGELAGQIADSVRTNEKAQHALLGAQYSDELKAILAKCHSQ